jgi:hypothetical protein
MWYLQMKQEMAIGVLYHFFVTLCLWNECLHTESYCSMCRKARDFFAQTFWISSQLNRRDECARGRLMREVQ